MIRLKHFDFYGQIVALIICLILTGTVAESWFMGAYFVIGGWQIISCVIHRAFHNQLLRATGRDVYEKILVAVLAVGACCCIVTALLYIYLVALLVVGAAMAFWYGIITYKEMRLWEARAFVHLK